MTTTRPTRVLLAALAIAVLTLAGCGKDKTPQVLSGMALTPPPSVGNVALPDATQRGYDFPFKAKADHLLLVYFGYMNCPDVCPTTLADVKKALARLGSTAQRVDLAMITIDPKRDSAEGLTKYVQAFVPGSHALRTDDDAKLRAAAKAFGAGYTVTVDSTGQEQVSHSANVYVVDPAGHIVLEWPFGLPPDALATDLQILFSHPIGGAA